MRQPARRLALILTLAALAGLAAAPAIARQYPPADPPSNEPQSTSQPDPDEASAPPPAPQSQQGAVQNQAQSPAYAGAPIAPPADGVSFDARVRASAAAAEGLQGPLDGGWTVRGDDGQAFYGLQLVDAGGGTLEGAWRDIRRTGAVGARGLLTNMERTGDDLRVRFYPRDGGEPVVLAVHAFSDDVWSGSLVERGVETPVSLTRNEPRTMGDYSGAKPRPVILGGYAPRHHYAPEPRERVRRDRHGRIIHESRGRHDRAERDSGRHGRHERGGGHERSSGSGHKASAHGKGGGHGGGKSGAAGKKKKKR